MATSPSVRCVLRGYWGDDLVASVCGVKPTYAATGPGGAAVRTTIDHWLARRLSDVLNEIVTHVSISAA